MSRYENKIKVVAPSKNCFPVDPETLQPCGNTVYDPWAFGSESEGEIEKIDIAEWQKRRMSRI